MLAPAVGTAPMTLPGSKMRVVVAPLPDSHVADSNSPAEAAPPRLSEPVTPLTHRAQPTPPPAPLELIESDESFLGAGSRGEVRLARLGDMYCAAKIVPLPAVEADAKGEGSSSPDEALVHPHLVRVYERRTVDGKIFELRELCQGGELFDSVAENGGLAADDASTCFSQVLGAVVYCHAAGVANGRLRPEHVLLDNNNCVKLLGFATRRGGGDGGGDAQERLRRPCSGLDAPELHGRETASARELARADLWALGMLLASLVTAEPPFAAADAAVCSRYATLVSQGLRVACPELSAAMPAPLLSLLERLLQPKPQDRPSAEEALAQLSGAPTAVAEAAEAAACAATSSASSSAGGGEAALLATAPFAAAAAAAASTPFGALSPTPPTTAVLDGTAGHANRSSSGGCAKTARTSATHGAVDAAAKAEDERGVDHSSKVQRTTQDARAMPPPPPPCVAASGSSSSSSSCSSSPGLMLPPPARVATPRPSPRNGHVRCLGWENLEVPFDLLSSAAVATLDTLGLPYTVESWVGPFGAAFSVRPPPPLEMALPPMPELRSPAVPDLPSFAGMASPLAPLALSLHGTPRPPLRVSLQIFSAEPAPAPASASASSAPPDRHHVDVRRQQGEHWHFQPFYAAFRLEFSKRLGMADYSQLSMHSPMQKKREVPAACAPAAGFLSRGQPSASPLSNPAGSSWTAASPLAQPSPGGTPGSSRGATGGATGGAGSFRRKSGSFTGFLPLAAAPSSLRAPPRP